MRFRGPIFFSVIFIGLFVAAFYPPLDNSEKEAVLIQTILDDLQRYHYAPKKIDDVFSRESFDLYLERLDGSRRWLTEEDYQLLKAYENQLDDEALAGSYEFFDLSIRLIEQGIQRTQSYYREALAQPFDFTEPASIEMDGEKRGFAKNEAALKEFWFQLMKYETMTRLADQLKEQETTEDEELKTKSLEDLEAEVRMDVLETYDDWYQRLEKRKRTDFLNLYLNSITNIFDPHTSYFEPIEKENFDINMSGKLEGIGARLQTDGDYTKVSSIVVGGPAWKQGQLKENDRIMKVAQDGEEPVNISGMDIDDVVQLIRGDKGTNVHLTVKKVDGTVEDITIERDVVILEEGFAKSLLMETEKNNKVGYISLPRFYDDFYDKNGRSCARDVATEIQKLKAEKVEGIILDLRNNGGGSLRDVIRMSGFFVEEGPIVQVKARGRSSEVLSDTDESVLWDGHLIIMVNNFSASASEIIAAALQDYGRAVIVGSSSTFGKGTVQRFFSLDRAVAGFNELKPLGDVKLTTQKFYRINGGSTQLKGVTPDIVLPDTYSFIETGEKANDYPMEWTEIASVNYDQKVLQLKNLEKIREKSAYRIQNNEAFNKIVANAKRVKEQRDDSEFSLILTEYQTEQEWIEQEAEAFEAVFDQVFVENIQNLPADAPKMEEDESKKARNSKWIEELQKDIHLKETLNIMQDLIKEK